MTRQTSKHKRPENGQTSGIVQISLYYKHMEDSVFTKIIKGEIPCHKVYEDEKTFAFLTINPVLPGHVLVVPKNQVDQFDELPDEDYQAVFNTVKKVAARVKEVFGTKRAVVMVMGFEVPHAHVHVVPCDKGIDFIKNSFEHAQLDAAGQTPEPNHAEMTEIAQKLAF